MTRFLSSIVSLCLFIPAALAADSEVKGKMTVADKEVALTHVLVVDFEDVEGMGHGNELRILFSDSEIAQSELESPVLFDLDGKARDGKLRGVLLRFDPKAESREVYGTTYLTPDDPRTSMPFFTLSGTGGVDTIKAENGKLSGSVENAADADADFHIPAYSFTISFSAPIKKSSPVTTLKGKEAMDSAQMKIYLKFEDAMGKGDLEAVKKLTSPEKVKQMEEFIAQTGKEQFLEMVKQMVSDPATREKQLAGLFIRGDRSTIVFDEDGGKMSVTLQKKGDAWIMD